MIEWIKVRHVRTGHDTEIPARVADSYRRRGWFPVYELADHQPAAPDIDPDDGAEQPATPTGVDGASSSDDSKENEQ